MRLVLRVARGHAALSRETLWQRRREVVENQPDAPRTRKQSRALQLALQGGPLADSDDLRLRTRVSASVQRLATQAARHRTFTSRELRDSANQMPIGPNSAATREPSKVGTDSDAARLSMGRMRPFEMQGKPRCERAAAG